MTTTTTQRTVDAAELARYRVARSDIVVEVEDGADRFVQQEGPFRRYERRVSVTPGPDGSDGFEVTETTDWVLDIPVWWIIYWVPTWFAFRFQPTRRGVPWWAPPERIDQRSARIIGLLATLAVFDGFLGSIISQTLTFAAKEFDVDRTGQAVTLAAVRIGVPLSLGFLIFADRRGRQPMMMVSGVAACAITALGGIAPSIWGLGVSQAIGRGITTALGILIIVVLAEEFPAGSRAYGTSVVVLAAGLGSGMVVWMLPLADLGPRGWRAIYLAPLLFIPAIIALVRRLPESKRFAAADGAGAARTGDDTARRRLIILGITAFLLSFVAAPASQFQNEFLTEDRGFSGTKITLFTIVTSTPVGLGVFFGGRLADLRGRRLVAIVGILASALFTVLTYATEGVLLWVTTLVAILVGGLVVPALSVYGPELFATRQRGRANGVISIVGVLGSASGLLLIGWLADEDRFGSFAPAFAIASIASVLAAITVAVAFPETARRELEELNPSDGQRPH